MKVYGRPSTPNSIGKSDLTITKLSEYSAVGLFAVTYMLKQKRIHLNQSS